MYEGIKSISVDLMPFLFNRKRKYLINKRKKREDQNDLLFKFGFILMPKRQGYHRFS